MTALPRAICPVCDKDVAVRRGGQLRDHDYERYMACPASGRTVAEAAELNRRFEAPQ